MTDKISLMQKGSLRAARRRVNILSHVAKGATLTEAAVSYGISAGRALDLVKAAFRIAGLVNIIGAYSMKTLRGNSFIVETECLNAANEIDQRHKQLEEISNNEKSGKTKSIEDAIKLLKKNGYKVTRQL